MKNTNIHYDKNSDSIYIFLKEGREHSFDEIQPNIIIEYNAKKQPIGIEILNASSSLLSKIASHEKNFSIPPIFFIG